jgi:hypothetical protein
MFVLRDAANGSAQQLMEALGAIAAQVRLRNERALLAECALVAC